MRRVYLKAKEAEKEMQEARESKEFTGKNEKLLIENLVKTAKNNSRIGDKLLMVIDPMEIHIPEWQRRIKLERAYSIGNNYNSYKWDEPKVLLYKGILLCIDGQHRIYGAFKAKKDAVVVEVMECSLEEAIDLFLSQSTLKVADLINRLKEIGYDENTELVFGCVDGDTGSWYQVPFDGICYGEEFTGNPYCKDVINIDVDIDSVKEYAKSKADGIVYNLVDDLGRVLRNYDIII